MAFSDLFLRFCFSFIRHSIIVFFPFTSRKVTASLLRFRQQKKSGHQSYSTPPCFLNCVLVVLHSRAHARGGRHFYFIRRKSWPALARTFGQKALGREYKEWKVATAERRVEKDTPGSTWEEQQTLAATKRRCVCRRNWAFVWVWIPAWHGEDRNHETLWRAAQRRSLYDFERRRGVTVGSAGHSESFGLQQAVISRAPRPCMGICTTSTRIIQTTISTQFSL